MNDQDATRAAGSSATACWPLPPEWDTFIPPQAVKIIEQHIPMDSTHPVWNETWLRGLEAYVRSIVRDELSKANAEHHARHAAKRSDVA